MTEAAAEKKFESTMTVGEALALHPNARWVLAAYHLGGCTHCAVSNEETLQQVSEAYGVPLDKLVDDLNTLFAS
jgi:hybrid cluster-associated redox disulfide protein